MNRETKFLILTSRLGENGDFIELGKIKDMKKGNIEIKDKGKIDYLCLGNKYLECYLAVICGRGLNEITHLRPLDGGPPGNYTRNGLELFNECLEEIFKAISQESSNMSRQNRIVAIHWGRTTQNEAKSLDKNLNDNFRNFSVQLEFSITYWSTLMDNHFYKGILQSDFRSLLEFWQLLETRTQGKEELLPILLLQNTIDFWIPFYYASQSKKKESQKDVFLGYFEAEFEKQHRNFLRQDFVNQLSKELKGDLEKIETFEDLDSWLNKVSETTKNA